MMDEDKWWYHYRNIVTLTDWMAANHYSAQEIAEAVEKPWHYGEEWDEASEEATREAART